MLCNGIAVGRVIGRLRAQKGLSQQALSELAGISRSHLTLLENGRKMMRLDTLFALADALGMKPSALVAMIEAEG